jgi:hypothetical protein
MSHLCHLLTNKRLKKTEIYIGWLKESTGEIEGQVDYRLQFNEATEEIERPVDY